MANTDRLEQMLQFFREDPNDPFNIYALALEYQKVDLSESKKYFDILLNAHREYIPAYYHAARVYEALGATDEAVAILERGMDIAQRSGEIKAFAEMKAAHEELTF